MDFSKEFRIGVANPDLSSLTFKVKKNGSDVYLVCREIDDLKLSLHNTGIHRLAENINQPRKPIQAARMDPHVPGTFTTVVRMVMTTFENWDISRGVIPKSTVKISPKINTDVIVVNLGFTVHHPKIHPYTNFIGNKATIAVKKNKFITATVQNIPIDKFIDSIKSLYSPAPKTTWEKKLVYNKIDENFFDEVQFFSTKHNTFVIWANHNIPKIYEQEWEINSAISKELYRTHNLQKMGLTFGMSPREGADILAGRRPLIDLRDLKI